MKRFRTGFLSALSVLGVPFGRWWCRDIGDLQSPDRYEHGLVVILPGIEGRSAVNLNLARGLDDANIPFAVEIVDWTSGWFWLSLYHLKSCRLHLRGAAAVADRVRRYQEQHPNRPTLLIGHSGGAGVLVKALEALPDDCRVTAAILLAAAVSPEYDLALATARLGGPLWNFHSSLDLFQLGIGTLVLGTIDGRYQVAAGNRGFRGQNADGAAHSKLEQIPFQLSMAASWNLGGHLGCTNRLFAHDWLAPKLLSLKAA